VSGGTGSELVVAQSAKKNVLNSSVFAAIFFFFFFSFFFLFRNVDGAMGFSDMLEETERMILDGEKGTVVVGTAKWGFDARNETEISFPVGAKIRVLDQHESGWWTGQYNGATGFFPGNRTELEELNMKEYKEMQKKLLLQPMFAGSASDAPALPDPMVKAGKILGISEKEAEALSRCLHNIEECFCVSLLSFFLQSDE
jgi:hypothetical protein